MAIGAMAKFSWEITKRNYRIAKRIYDRKKRRKRGRK